MAIDKANSKLSRGEGVLKVKAKENKAKSNPAEAAANKKVQTPRGRGARRVWSNQGVQVQRRFVDA
jgi:hypothetical protein